MLKRDFERNGVVFTPLEIIDFINFSVKSVLSKQFGTTVNSENVFVYEPFAGDGRFIRRMIDCEILKDTRRTFLNEIMECSYLDCLKNSPDILCENITNSDTFSNDNFASENGIKVFVTNPPYRVGQKSENDNNGNVVYPKLDEEIRSTYAANSKATLKNALYDSYIRAIRWASDRIGGAEGGIVAYVSGGAWTERSFADGMRKCLNDEFTSIYVFNLRGDIRKNMLSKGRVKEGGNVFGSGSMTGISITLFIKNPNQKRNCEIFYHDIGDDLTPKEKLNIISGFKSIDGITKKNAWDEITPDKHNDWLDQRDNSFDEFIPLGDKKDKSAVSVFELFSQGVLTSRDSWCYNSSKSSLEKNMRSMIDFYNNEVDRFMKSSASSAKDFINNDPAKISWSRALKNSVTHNKKYEFFENKVVKSCYRPFLNQWMYFDTNLNEMVYQMPKIFPKAGMENLVICVSGTGARSGFSALIVNSLPCYDMVEKGQCFPLKIYEKNSVEQNMFHEENSSEYTVKDGISDAGLKHFQKAYPKEKISKEDVFYYTYGLLHSEQYRTKYTNNLSKQLPHIPCVKKAESFWKFSTAGEKLADLHVNHEDVDPYEVKFNCNLKDLKNEDFRVEKMKFSGKIGNKDKSKIIYNSKITLSEIPLDAYDYFVNGKSAIEWVIDRQCVKTDKASGIINDSNLYATETVGDAEYPLKLLQRVITVSLETIKIVKTLDNFVKHI